MTSSKADVARREAVWQVFRDMHDEPQLRAAGGWCAPTEVIYHFATLAEFDAMPPRRLTGADMIAGRF